MHARHLVLASFVLAGCQSVQHPPLEVVTHVDLPRFMGDWYVIASTPTRIDENAFNAVESYRLAPDGTIETTYRFLDGGFDGETRIYTPRGFVRDRTSNAVWGMQFVWPVKADYRISYLAPDYSRTVIGREKRDYVWIMARSPQIAEAEYLQLVDFVESQGYDTSRLRKVPQRWESRTRTAGAGQ
jgi:apolipoprotein D and lipocalin family protein